MADLRGDPGLGQIRQRNEIEQLVDRYQPIAQFLNAAARDIKVLYYLEPSNSAAEKARFLASPDHIPQFEYRAAEYDTAAYHQRLSALEIPAAHPALAALFLQKRDRLIVNNDVIAARGVGELAQSSSITIYGRPSEELVLDALAIARETPPAREPLTVSPNEIVKSLEAALARYGLNDWRIDYETKQLITTYPAEKKITVPAIRKFRAGDAERLAVHEVGVHAIRAANGYAQPIEIFATGTASYEETEEGLATYAEKIHGYSDPSMLRGYALRVLAVNSMTDGGTFPETYSLLRELQCDEEQAWTLSVRAHRGGGYCKDHIYLAGLGKIERYVAGGGDLRALAIGKVAIDDLSAVAELLQDGIVREAKYTPAFIG